MAPRRETIDFWSVPNLLTSVRLLLVAPLIVAIEYRHWALAALLVVVAIVTDWLDGYFARKLGITSSFGRAYDPLVDKVLMSGAFVTLLAVHDTPLAGDAGLSAWIVVVVIAREFLVTFFRGYLEQLGVAFGADLLGKLKMALQCAYLLFILTLLAVAHQVAGVSTKPAWLDSATTCRDLLVFAMTATTILSGINYGYRFLTTIAIRPATEPTENQS